MTQVERFTYHVDKNYIFMLVVKELLLLVRKILLVVLMVVVLVHMIITIMKLQAEAAAIYRDEMRLAPYRQLFENQTEEGNMALTGKRKLYVRLDSFVLACLLKEHPLIE